MSDDAGRRAAPWGLEAGPETCEFCLHTYHYEAGYHCVHCDRPVCPLCVMVVREREVVVCPDCHAGGD